jgi:hypothetical protein
MHGTARGAVGRLRLDVRKAAVDLLLVLDRGEEQRIKHPADAKAGERNERVSKLPANRRSPVERCGR